MSDTIMTRHGRPTPGSSYAEFCEHQERRTRVTLRDYRATRWAVAHGRAKVDNWAYFMSSPADAPRVAMRDQLPRLNTPEKLASKAARFLTLASEYAARKRGNPLHKPVPKYEDWLRTFMPAAEAKREAARINALYRREAA
jgi:hypothetical protein